MTLVLQESPDCYHLLPADKFDRNNSSFPHLAYEFRLHDPKGMSHGSRQWFHLRPGISLLVDDYHLREDLVIVTSPNQTCNYLELGFSIINHSGSADLRTGKNFVSLANDSGEIGYQEWEAQERLFKLDIHIEYSLLKSLIFPHLETLPINFKKLIEQDDSEISYFQIGRTTPQMQTILGQIVNCPYQAFTKQLYLEAKILELMALRLQDLQDSLLCDPNITLKPEQIDSIYQAKEILIDNYTNPPTLIALARQVNLNDCTLKKGFQQIFGTTVFGYLHNYRMEKAKELLLEKQMNVTQVAQFVGYTARSAFVRAFSSKFGVSPSDYMQGNSV